MGFVAAAAVALTACFATAAAGGVTVLGAHVPSWLYPIGLLPGLVIAMVRGAGWSRPSGRAHEAAFSIALIASAVLVIAGFSGGARSTTTAPAAAVAVVLLSVYWPDPLALGIGILAGFVYLVTGRHGAGATAWTVAAVAAGAFAAVTTTRLHRAQLPTYGSTAPDWRRTARDGALVLVIAGLFGGLLAAVLPPPPPKSSDSDASQPGPGALNPLGLGPGLNLSEPRKGGDDTILLRVEAREPDVWRAGTFETWTGRSWRFSEVPAAEGDPGGSQDLRVPVGPGEVINPHPPLVQRVTVETDYAQVVVAAPVPTRVIASPHSYVLSYAGVLVEGPVMRRHSTYVVESSRGAVSADTLRNHDPLGAPIPVDLGGYAAAPPSDDRTRELAETVASGAPTGYDKAVAISNWLAANIAVRDTDGAVPRGSDVVSHVLFVDHGGRIERVATAMVVMLRTLGVPARLGVGFRPGERPSAGGPFTVRASDAGAWAEVWFPGAGWQRFDPTGTLAARTTIQAESIWSRLSDLTRRLWPALLLAVAAGVALLLAVRARRRLAIEALPWTTRFYGRVLRAGAKRDRPRRAHETPVEYTAALAESVIPDPRLVEVGRLVTSAAYSRHAPSPAEQEWAESVLNEAIGAAPAGGRRSISGRRFGSPKPS